MVCISKRQISLSTRKLNQIKYLILLLSARLYGLDGRNSCHDFSEKPVSFFNNPLGAQLSILILSWIVSVKIIMPPPGRGSVLRKYMNGLILSVEHLTRMYRFINNPIWIILNDWQMFFFFFFVGLICCYVFTMFKKNTKYICSF